MVSRNTARKWGCVALGLALLPATSLIEGRLAAQSNTVPFSAVKETAYTKEYASNKEVKNAEATRELLRKARTSFQAGDFAAAEQFARQAQATGALPYWEVDTPERMLADITNTRAKAGPNADPKTLLKQARESLTAGRLDEAQALASRANAANGKWAMFDDTPTKCMEDLQRARGKAEKAEALRLMVDARKCFEQGKLDEAEGMAYRAERLHGGFSMLEGGDRPQKLLSDVQAARAKTKKTNGDSEILRVSGISTNTSSSREQAKALISEGKSAMRWGRLAEARVKFMEAQKLNADFKPDEENPIRCLNDLMNMVNRQVREAASLNCNAGDPQAAKEACEERLLQARQLAVEFELDVRPIDAKLSAMKDGFVPASMEGPQAAAPVVPTAETPRAESKSVHVQAAMLPPAATAAQPALIPSTTGSASSGDSLAGQAKALQKIEFQRMREEGQKAQSEANKLFERGETGLALETLQNYLTKVKSCQLEASEVSLLSRPVENRLQTLKLVKSQKDSDTKITGRKAKHDAEMSRAANAEERKREQLKDLMKQYGQCWKEGKYAEAKLIAGKARVLDPEDPALLACEEVANAKMNKTEYDQVKEAKARLFVKAMNQTEDPGPPVDDKNPMWVDPAIAKMTIDRGVGTETVNLRNRSQAEREIMHKLSAPVDLNFQNTPLRQVIDDIRAMTSLNIVTEITALDEEHISLDQPVTIKLDAVCLEKALKNLLSQVHLTTVVADDVLKITTEKKARGRMVSKVYRVADLVMPIEDYIQPNALNLQKSLDRVIEQQNINLRNGAGAFNGGKTLPNGTPANANGEPTLTTNGVAQPQLSTSPTGATTMAKQTMQEMLIKLIQNTVAPQSWADVGGSGSIEYMPIGMALIINQTTDVQEQVEDLLNALRRLQDLQVHVEIKLITLSETFFERIGLDFNLNLKTDSKTRKFEPQITSGQFKPAGQVNDFTPNGFVAGLSPAGNGSPGNFTSDLDIPIRSSSFQYGIPPFAYPNNPGFDGGLSMGLAFLSDIQVFMFMEAAQGDRRIHVMQAPKLTLFNGQSANMSVQDQQFFVTNVGVVGFGGQIVFTPQNNPFPLGVEMTLQAVVSADRRFVRMNINQRMANLASANVPLFPVTTFITPVFESGAQGQPIPFQQFIQQPQLSLINIQTTVSVPDGGTVIIGGLKTLSEGRNEFGPPVLSKLPYVNRLFRNSGFGREAQSLLMMVTPRVIINSEEETKQTGVVSNPD